MKCYLKNKINIIENLNDIVFKGTSYFETKQHKENINSFNVCEEDRYLCQISCP
jgi:hypothetical protein